MKTSEYGLSVSLASIKSEVEYNNVVSKLCSIVNEKTDMVISYADFVEWSKNVELDTWYIGISDYSSIVLFSTDKESPTDKMSADLMGDALSNFHEVTIEQLLN